MCRYDAINMKSYFTYKRRTETGLKVRRGNLHNNMTYSELVIGKTNSPISGDVDGQARANFKKKC